MAYAKTTKVSVISTKAEIEKMVKHRYGATSFGIMEYGNTASIAFQMEGRNILLKMSIPENPQEERSKWRAMLLTIKGKLESAERGIETFDEAFLANIMMPNGLTVAESTVPAITKHYSGDVDVPLLPKM